MYPWKLCRLTSELVSQRPKHFLARRENLSGLYKDGRQNTWIPKALKEFVTFEFCQSKQNNEITEKKLQTQGLLCWTLPERKNDHELTCKGNILCGLSLEKEEKQARVWWGEGVFSTCDSN